jgi:TatD DNase family protein
MTCTWFDSHCHLDLLSNQHINQSMENKVTNFIIPAVGKDIKKASAISNKLNNTYFTVGIHPLFISNSSDSYSDIFKQIESILNNDKKCVGLGETGLDYFPKNINRQLQCDIFLKHLQIANKLKCPVIIHLRKGFEDFWSIASDFRNLTYIMHMFSGSKEIARKYQNSFPNMYFSFGAPHINKNNKKGKETVKSIPLEKILIETDSPDLPPKGFEKPNTPANLPFIGTEIAKLLNIKVSALAEITKENGRKAFSWKAIWKD